MSRGRFLLVFAALLCVTFVGGCFLLPNRPPEAAFVVIYDVDQTDPLAVGLDASSSSDPDGDAIVAYSWVFGDDVTILSPLEFSKLVQTPLIRIRFPFENTYSVTLVIRDSVGNSSAPVSQTVTVPIGTTD